jgi:DNA-binding LytR/AlgR family response regulator
METHSASYGTNRTTTLRKATIGTIKLAGMPAFDPAGVLYLEGSGNYTIIHFNDGRKQIVTMTLMLVADQLPDLIRVHKSYAVSVPGIGNIRWVGKLANKRVLVLTMRNKVRIAVARRKANEIAPALAQRTGIVIGQQQAGSVRNGVS